MRPANEPIPYNSADFSGGPFLHGNFSTRVEADLFASQAPDGLVYWREKGPKRWRLSIKAPAGSATDRGY